MKYDFFLSFLLWEWSCACDSNRKSEIKDTVHTVPCRYRRDLKEIKNTCSAYRDKDCVDGCYFYFICNQFELIATNRLSSTLTIHFLKDRQAVTLYSLDSRTLTACLTFQKCCIVSVERRLVLTITNRESEDIFSLK